MDELDRISESLMVLRTNSGDSSLSKSETQSFPATKVKAAVARTPSELRAWVFGDFCAEMITALCELGVAPRNIRSWNNLRSSGPRPPPLAEESPDWLFINMPQAMKERHPHVKSANLAAFTRRLIARLIKAQDQAGRHFAMFGNPLTDLWDPDHTPELANLFEEWHIAEFRWCNMGVRHPETARVLGREPKSSAQSRSGMALVSPNSAPVRVAPATSRTR